MARKYQSAVQSGHTVLVVDDNPEMLETSRRMLEAEGHRVLTATHGEEGIAVALRDHPHLMLVDYFMPGITGEEVVKRVREHDRLVQIILVTGYSGEKPARVMMRQLDIQGYHDKSEGAEHLLLWVDSALKAYSHMLSMEKHRTGLRYILEITPELHRLQPLDDLLQGLLWQVEGLLGAENSFLATVSSQDMVHAAGGEIEGFVALMDRGDQRTALEIRIGTGRFRPGITLRSLPELERTAILEAVSSGEVRLEGGASVVPLRLTDQTLGVIYLDRNAGVARDRELLEIFAAQAAAAIQSALLYGQNALLFDLATKDTVSGVSLRGHASQQLLQHLKRGHRMGHPVSLIMVDLDRFKAVNDTHGHIVGDQALRAVGDLLQRCVRETDCVGRFGGDEFIIILPDTPAEGAATVAERLLEGAARLSVGAEGDSIPIRLSVGQSTLLPAPDGPDYRQLRMETLQQIADQLIANADHALYQVKGQAKVGRGAVVTWGDILAAAA